MEPITYLLLAAKNAVLDGRIEEAIECVNNYKRLRSEGVSEPVFHLPTIPFLGIPVDPVKGDDYVKTLEWAIDRNMND